MNRACRYLVHFILFYTCIEGLVINIQYPAMLSFLYKDFAILGLYVLLILTRGASFVAPSPAFDRLTMWLLMFALICAVYLLFPGELLAQGVALKQHLFYIPLMAVGYLFIESGDDVRRLYLALMVYSVGVSAFGIYLYFGGPSALSGLGAHYSTEVHTAIYDDPLLTYWRVPGTFTSAGQYGAYLLFNGIVAFGVLITSACPKRDRLLASVAVVAVLLATLTSGSRAPFILLTGMMVLVVLLCFDVRRVLTAIFGLYLVLSYGFAVLGAQVEDRFASIGSYEHVQRVQDTYLGQLFWDELLQDPFGSGLGKATIAARHFGGLEGVKLMESYLGIVAVEIGVLGLLAFVMACSTIIAMIMSCRRLMKTSRFTVFWHALAAYVFTTVSILTVSTGIDHPPTNVYFWFSLGVLVRLADLQRGSAETGEQPRAASRYVTRPAQLASWRR